MIGLLIYWFYFESFLLAAAIGAGMFVLGGMLLYSFHKSWKNPEKNLLHIIDHTPERILWVYTLETQLMPFGFKVIDKGLIYFKMTDGEEISIKLSAKNLKLVSRFLNRLLPEAMFGYSEEKLAKYQSMISKK